jgi:ligand-binding sensor domain-containing protein
VDAASAGGAGGSGVGGSGDAGATGLSQNAALQQLLANWVVGEILVRDDEIWFDLSARCTDCQVSPIRSDIPQTHKLVIVSNGVIKTFASGGENGVRALTMDSQHRVFAVQFGPDVIGGVVELSGLPSGAQALQDVRPLFPTQGAYHLAVDSTGNIWLATLQGLQKWNGTTSILYDNSNSVLPTNEVYGLAIDKQDAVWVGLGFADGLRTGIVRILGDKWQYTPYSSISALASAEYASVECVDKDNNLWVSPFVAGIGSPLVRYDGTSWIPDTTGRIVRDSSGTAWKTSSTSSANPSVLEVVNSLAYLDQGIWRPVDVSGVARSIVSLDVYQTTLILGTDNGLVLLDGFGTGGAGGTSGTGG